MRKAFAAVACLAVALPALAERRSAGPNVAPVDLQMRVHAPGSHEAVRTIAAARAAVQHSRSGIGASAVTDNRSTRMIVIPVVGDAISGGGTHYKSDVTLVNYNESSQPMNALYMPNGNPAGTIAASFSIPGDRPPFTIIDFVGTQLGVSGIGALLLVPVDGTGEFDPNAAIDAHSRIYTPQPANPAGSVSMQFPGVDPSHLEGEYQGMIMGLRHQNGFRTNFGIVNLEQFPIDFSVTVFPETASPGTQLTVVNVTIQPFSMLQQVIPDTVSGPVNIVVAVEQDIPGDDQWWTAYGASVDNITGDGWVGIAAAMLDDEDLDERGQ